MSDEVQCGWLAGDDYRAAVERAGAKELPDDGIPDGEPWIVSALAPVVQPPDTTYQELLARVDGRWEDSDPPGCPR
ncbi:MAG TPA: hypothetical protein VIS06_16640 [Mycobacteriales bacterium]